MVARHFRRRLLILSVSTLGFLITSFSIVLATDFTGSVVSVPVVSVLDGDTIEVLRNHHPEHIRLNGIAALRRDKFTARGLCMRNKKWPTRQLFVVRPFHGGAGKMV